MLKTRPTELFGIEQPIVQGGMQRVSKPELVFRIVADAEQIINDSSRGLSR